MKAITNITTFARMVSIRNLMLMVSCSVETDASLMATLLMKVYGRVLDAKTPNFGFVRLALAFSLVTRILILMRPQEFVKI